MNIDRVQKVFVEVFGDENIKINPTLTAKNVENWDSFNHINLVMALEEEFDLTFSTDAIASMANVGDLVTTLQDCGVDISWD